MEIENSEFLHGYRFLHQFVGYVHFKFVLKIKFSPTGRQPAISFLPKSENFSFTYYQWDGKLAVKPPQLFVTDSYSACRLHNIHPWGLFSDD